MILLSCIAFISSYREAHRFLSVQVAVHVNEFLSALLLLSPEKIEIHLDVCFIIFQSKRLNDDLLSDCMDVLGIRM